MGVENSVVHSGGSAYEVQAGGSGTGTILSQSVSVFALAVKMVWDAFCTDVRNAGECPEGMSVLWSM